MSDSESKSGEKKLITIKNAADLQRLKIEKLMKNPDKPVVIPERPKSKALAPPPDFVRNVMGSSAGAGSGEFHVYRHLRRKEYARQKFIQEKSEKEKLDEEYHKKIEENKRAAEEKTAKKRAKRLRKKRNAKLKGKKPKSQNQQNLSSSQSDSSSDSENGNENDGDDEKTDDNPEDSRHSNTNPIIDPIEKSDEVNSKYCVKSENENDKTQAEEDKTINNICESKENNESS